MKCQLAVAVRSRYSQTNTLNAVLLRTTYELAMSLLHNMEIACPFPEPQI